MMSLQRNPKKPAETMDETTNKTAEDLDANSESQVEDCEGEGMIIEVQRKFTRNWRIKEIF